MNSKITLVLLGIVSLTLAGCLPIKKTESNETKQQYLSSGDLETYTVKAEDVFVDMVDGLLKVSNQANAISYKGGKVDYLNCEEGDVIEPGELIATITPDFSSPAIKTSLNAQQSLIAQKNNLVSIIQNTSQSFDFQLQSLQDQKTSLQQQIKLLEENLQKQQIQKQLTSGDLQSQIKALEQQLSGLKNNYQLLESSKQSQLDYISSQLNSKLASLKVSIDDFLVGVDKLFGISEDYLHYNDGIEIYLSAKKPSYKDKIINLWFEANNKFNKWDELPVEKKIDVISKIANLADLVVDALDDSVAGPTFPQSQIDSLRLNYTNASQNFHEAYGGLKSLLDQYKATKASFDSQLQSLQTQIDSVVLNLQNLKSNKSSQALLGADIQINSLRSQLRTLKSSLSQVENQIENLQAQKQIQLKNLNNQLETINKSLADIGVNISQEQVESKRKGVIKKRLASQGSIVGPGTPLCLIALEGDSQAKILSFRSEEILKKGDIVKIYTFDDQRMLGTGEIVKIYPTKGPITNKFVYEADAPFLKNYPEGEKFKIRLLLTGKGQGYITIPLEFLKAKLGGYWVLKLKSGNVVSQPVIVGEIIDQRIQILSGLNVGDIIVK